MGNCQSTNNKGDAIGIAGIAVGSVVMLFVAGEYGINYYGDALYYGVISGLCTGALVFAAQNHFNIGEMTAGGFKDFFSGLVCAFE